MLLVHPDKSGVDGAEAAFKVVSEAYQTLSDPDERAAYDTGRRASGGYANWSYAAASFAAPPSPSPGQETRPRRPMSMHGPPRTETRKQRRRRDYQERLQRQDQRVRQEREARAQREADEILRRAPLPLPRAAERN